MPGAFGLVTSYGCPSVRTTKRQTHQPCLSSDTPAWERVPSTPFFRHRDCSCLHCDERANALALKLFRKNTCGRRRTGCQLVAPPRKNKTPAADIRSGRDGSTKHSETGAQSVVVRQISPHVVKVAVPGCAGGIVTLAAEEPELAEAVDKGRRITPSAGCPDVVRLVRSRQVAVAAVLAACVRSFNPGPRPSLSRRGVRRIDPHVVEGAVAIRCGRIQTPSAKEPEVPALIHPGGGSPTRSGECSGRGGSQTYSASCADGSWGTHERLGSII